MCNVWHFCPTWNLSNQASGSSECKAFISYQHRLAPTQHPPSHHYSWALCARLNTIIQSSLHVAYLLHLHWHLTVVIMKVKTRYHSQLIHRSTSPTDAVKIPVANLPPFTHTWSDGTKRHYTNPHRGLPPSIFLHCSLLKIIRSCLMKSRQKGFSIYHVKFTVKHDEGFLKALFTLKLYSHSYSTRHENVRGKNGNFHIWLMHCETAPPGV